MIASVLIGRMGSTGFPGKNTIEIEGKPMAAWPLDAAMSSSLIDLSFVSTDDPEIKRIATDRGVQIIDRPKRLADDQALGEDVFAHAHSRIVELLGAAGTSVELYVLLMANAVTISTEQIDAAINVMRNRSDVDSAVSVSRYNMFSPLRARRIDEDGLLRPFVPFETFGDPRSLNCDRDSQGDVWFADMGVSVVRPENLERIGDGLLPQKWMGQRIFPIPNEAGLDIDYPYQLPQAEFWLRNRP